MTQPVNLISVGGGVVDAFARMRVSDPVTLFDSQMQYNTSPLLWESALTGSGTATHLPNEAAIRLRCTTARAQASAPGSSAISLLSRLPLTLNIAGAHPTTPFSDVLTVVATTAEATDPTLVFAAMNWRELY